jgi:hypothetical protein
MMKSMEDPEAIDLCCFVKINVSIVDRIVNFQERIIFAVKSTKIPRVDIRE